MDNLLLGRAGELRVASELLLRGMRPALSMVDTGVDLVCENGVTIQVKAAHRGKESRGRYRFNCRRWDREQGHALKGVDFIVCWGVDTDDFWIFPADVVRGQLNISLGAPSEAVRRNLKHTEYHKAWDLICDYSP